MSAYAIVTEMMREIEDIDYELRRLRNEGDEYGEIDGLLEARHHKLALATQIAERALAHA